MLIACTLFTVAAVIALVIAERVDSAAARLVIKPLASLGFVGAAVAAGALESRPGQAILVGLVLSLVGDVLLISHARRAFLAGLGSFLLGHVAFAAAFVIRGVEARWAAGALVPLVATAVIVARWLLPHVEAAMRGAVVAYVVVITPMVALSVGTVAAGGHPLLLAAAVCFFLSDLSVARDRFVAPGFGNRLWGLPLYYIAQLLFAFSLAASR